MCFELDSLPPIPVIRGAAVSHEDLVLEARDGNRVAAFAAAPDDPTGIGIVILPDVRGLYRFYEELALRFAELRRKPNAVPCSRHALSGRSGWSSIFENGAHDRPYMLTRMPGFHG